MNDEITILSYIYVFDEFHFAFLICLSDRNSTSDVTIQLFSSAPIVILALIFMQIKGRKLALIAN